MRSFRSASLYFVFAFVSTMALCVVSSAPIAAQVTISTGGLTGTVTDAQGSAVGGAKVTVSSAEAGVNQGVTTDTAGYYTIGALAPGKYSIKIESANFKTFQTTVMVQVGQMTTVNARLEIGSSATVVEVTGSAITVNSEQAAIQDVLTAADID